MRWAGHVALWGEMKNSRKIVVEKSEGKKQFERAKNRWRLY